MKKQPVTFLLYILPSFLLLFALSSILTSLRPGIAEIINSKAMQKIRSVHNRSGIQLDWIYLGARDVKKISYPINEASTAEFLGAQMIATASATLDSSPSRWRKGLIIFRDCALDEKVRPNLRNLCLAQYRKYCAETKSCF